MSETPNTPDLNTSSSALPMGPGLSPELQGQFDALLGWFNATVDRLEVAYKHLEQKFEDVNSELARKTTELEAATKRHFEVSEQLKVLLGSLQPGVLMVNPEDELTVLNPTAAKFLSLDPHLALGQHIEELLPNHSALRSGLQRALAEKGAVWQEEKWIEYQGSTLPMALKFASLGDGEGKVLGAVVTLTDLSPLKKLEEEVQQAKILSALGEMAATVAHEIRNPLGGIGGYAGLLARGFEAEDPRKRLVDKIIYGVSSLNKIVSNLLTYTRKTSLRRYPVDLREFARDVLAHMEVEAEKLEKPVVLELVVQEGASDPWTADVDAEKLQQVLLNLLINALQAVGDAGVIRLEVLRVDQHICLRVQDNGCGMDEETLQNAFNPFFTTKEQGTGLGLAISKKIMDLHSGRIELQSTIGQGTTFSLIFPVISNTLNA
jgi:PAS domain S-box-containing protein